MKVINWVTQYNKALVPLVMTLVYFLNTRYGIEIPLKESDVVIAIGIITGFITWAVPNKEM